MASFKLFIKGDHKKCWSTHKKIFNFLERDLIFSEIFANSEIMQNDGMLLDIDWTLDYNEYEYIKNINNVTIISES